MIIPWCGGATEALGPALSEVEWVGSHRSPILLSDSWIAPCAAVAVKRQILGVWGQSPQGSALRPRVEPGVHEDHDYILGLPTKNPEAPNDLTLAAPARKVIGPLEA